MFYTSALLGFISPKTSNSRQIVGTFGHKEGNQSLWPTAIKPTQTKQPILLRFCVGWGSSFITGLVFLLPPKWPFHRLQKARLDSLISFTAPQLTDGPQTPLSDAATQKAQFSTTRQQPLWRNLAKVRNRPAGRGNTVCKTAQTSWLPFACEIISFYSPTCTNPLKVQSYQFTWMRGGISLLVWPGLQDASVTAFWKV